MDTRTTPGDRRWLEVHHQLPKLWMYVGSTVLRRSSSKRPLVFPFPSSAKGRQYAFRQIRGPGWSNRQAPAKNGRSIRQHSGPDWISKRTINWRGSYGEN